jgi:cytochrome P450
MMNDQAVVQDFDPTEEETFTSFHEEFARLRQMCPVARSEAWNGFWAVTKHKDIVDMLARNHDLYSTQVQNVVPKVAFTGRRPPLHLDPPEHTPYRKALNPFFTNEKMKKLEPKVRDIVVELLQPLIEKETFDMSFDYGYRFPAYVFALVFNLPVDLAMEVKDIGGSNNTLKNTTSRKIDLETMHKIGKERSLKLYDIARRIIEDRKAKPQDPGEDIVSALLVAKDQNGNLLPEDMILGMVRQLLLVGMIAPSVFVGCVAYHLAEHPDIQEMLRQNPHLSAAATEEYLRLFTPYRGFARTAKEDVVLGGRLIRKDEPIAIVYASANRDEEVFPEPDKFILHRPNINQSLAFGLGTHQCPGAPLARIMMRITLEELLARTRSIEVVGEVKMARWPEWGTISVPLKVVPA